MMKTKIVLWCTHNINKYYIHYKFKKNMFIQKKNKNISNIKYAVLIQINPFITMNALVFNI